MDTVSLRDLLESKLTSLDQKVDRIIQGQKETSAWLVVLDGRVRKMEIAVALLQWAYGLGAVIVGWVVVEIVKR